MIICHPVIQCFMLGSAGCIFAWHDQQGVSYSLNGDAGEVSVPKFSPEMDLSGRNNLTLYIAKGWHQT